MVESNPHATQEDLALAMSFGMAQSHPACMQTATALSPAVAPTIAPSLAPVAAPLAAPPPVVVPLSPPPLFSPPPSPPPPPPPMFTNVMTSGMSLMEGQLLSDSTGTHVLIVQNNGNIVMNSKGSGVDKIVWQSNTIPNPPYNPFVLTMQVSGALVLQDAHGTTVWTIPAPGTLNPPYQLVMQDDGNLVLYGEAGAYWGSGSNGL